MLSNNVGDGPHRLRLLLELSRLGSMRAVADELGYTTSTVSQQLAVLAREAGATLIEPEGRRVRLTPAGRRLADHAVTILAALEAARADLDPDGEPAGTVRVAGFATAVRRSLVPVARAALAPSTPRSTCGSTSTSPPRRSRSSPPTRSTSRSSTTTRSRRSRFDPALRRHAAVVGGLGARRARGGDAATPGGRRAGGLPALRRTPGGSSTRATSPTSRSSARSPRSRASSRGSRTARTASSSCRTSSSRGSASALLPADGRLVEGVRLVALRRPDVTLRSYAVDAAAGARAGRRCG